MAGNRLSNWVDSSTGALTQNYKDTSVKASNSVTQSNFAGTKEWKGGSKQIANFAGSTVCHGQGNQASRPGRHPEGVKGGNSDFPRGSYSD